MHRFLVAALVVVACSTAVPAASAQAPPDERKAAAAFADAAFAFTVEARALRPRLAPGLRRVGRCFLRAVTAIDRLPERRADRVADRVAGLFAVGLGEALITPLQPAFDRIVARLDAVATRDRVLRSGRAAWRASAVQSRRFPGDRDACRKLDRWRLTNFSPRRVPSSPTASQLERTEGIGREPRFPRAIRRLRSLGVSARAARRFDAERIADVVGLEALVFGEADGETNAEPLR